MSDPRDSFELEERSDGERTVVALRGDRRPVVLDLDGLTFIDSTGIRLVLESVRHREEEDWDFTVTRGSPVVRRLFATTSIAGRLPYAEGR